MKYSPIGTLLFFLARQGSITLIQCENIAHNKFTSMYLSGIVGTNSTVYIVDTDLKILDYQ